MINIVSTVTIKAPYSRESFQSSQGAYMNSVRYGHTDNWRRWRPKKIAFSQHSTETTQNVIGYCYESGRTRSHKLQRPDAIVARINDWKKACVETIPGVQFEQDYDRDQDVLRVIAITQS